MLHDIGRTSLRSRRKTDSPPRSVSPSTGNDVVTDVDRAAVEDVGAQAASVDERPQEARARDTLEVGAWLAQASADALGGSNPETTADQGVERDASSDHIPPRALPR